jgi:hypothetical protein
MRKTVVMKYLPQKKELTERFRQMEREESRLYKEADRIASERQKLGETLDEIQNLTVFNDFPIDTIEASDGSAEIWAGCDDVTRYARASQYGDQWAVQGHRDESAEGTDLGMFRTRNKALAAAKHYVSTGKPLATASKNQGAKATAGVA